MLSFCQVARIHNDPHALAEPCGLTLIVHAQYDNEQYSVLYATATAHINEIQCKSGTWPEKACTCHLV